MKPKLFKIRSIIIDESLKNSSPILDRQKPTTSRNIEIPDVGQRGQFIEFMDLFKTFMKENNEKSKVPVRSYDLQARDREVIIDPPQREKYNGKISDGQLRRWTARVIKTVSSASFNYFSQNQMNFEQAKVYCSENIFRNIVILAQENGLTAKQIQIIDKHIKDNVLDLLSAKYPLADSTEIHKNLEEIVQQVDNTDSVNNNYFTHTDLIFEYREDGNYNDLIMQMMNEVINLADKQIASKEKKNTNLINFGDFMSNIFKNLQDESWMNQDKNQDINDSQLFNDENSEQIAQVELQGQNSIKLNLKLERYNKSRQSYKSKVREYTAHSIGRKIPLGIPTYSQKEIENKNMSVKSPFIMHILANWCDQLWEKYESGDYYTNRSESIKVQRGGYVNSLLAWMRQFLDSELRQQKKEIIKYEQQLIDCNYQMQANILQRQIERIDTADQYLEDVERIRGKFSLQLANNLNSCIISLINKLIHGLLKVAKKMHYDGGLGNNSFWPTPPNLLTFHVGDIMSCYFQSKQNQILRVYKQLQTISIETPQRLRIVNIKNQLRTDNHLLIYVIFNNSIRCEIKLRVTTLTSNFIKCSNLFHHYLDSLKHSHFGPLIQLCSIWSFFDKKSMIFQELINSDNLKAQRVDHTCKKLNKKFQMVKYEQPFVCGQCNITYFHQNYLRHHQKCNLCGFLRCAKCKLIQQDGQVLLRSLIINPTLKKQCKRRVLQSEQLPKFGVCVLIESKIPKTEIFTHIVQQGIGKQFLLGRKNGKIYQIQNIASEKDRINFRSKYIVFELKANSSSFITDLEATKQYILPRGIKSNYLKQKQSISLMGQQLASYECKQILSVGTPSQKEIVKNLFLADNLFNQLPFDPQQFPNLSWLTLSRNTITDFTGLQKCNNLNNFIGVSCGLEAIPKQFYNLKNIKKLSFSINSIKQISDQIGNLTKLQQFQLNENQLSCIPQNLCECQNLQAIKVQYNIITSLPQNIHKLHKLKTLICNNNLIEKLPERIGELQNLREINISENYSFSSFPNTLYSLKKLQILDASKTSIDIIPQQFGQLSNLKAINFANCSKIIGPPSSISKLKNLEKIDFTGLYQMQLPKDIWDLTALKNINLSSCNLSELHRSFKELKKIETLNLSSNQLGGSLIDLYENFTELRELIIDSNNLEAFPKLSNCRKLVVLSLSNNAIKQIPNQIMQNLIALQQFRVASNQLQYFPLSITKLQNLTIFEATKNCLKNIIKQTQLQDLKVYNNSMWPNLKSFLFNNNNLTEIPSIIFKSLKLMDLFLSSNQVGIIPHEIGRLNCLKNIELNYNQVKDLPIELSQINNLEGIYISYNQITIVPAHLQKSTSLKCLYVDGCPIQTIQTPEWIINNGISCGELYNQVFAIIKEKGGIQLIEKQNEADGNKQQNKFQKQT